ncbi:hypothetical protein GCM10010969_34800 [Saccharibacillus kuerlensis]|uniref:Uncharacterized protein n=1 Tax=Saccharibacillus kuerlensis TaxID=459527 RepID=A0ABQ2L8J2_9BACL|nr:hypothetical protein GCM10010969_34800 [Saccharibacillus kuerlensis]
MGTQEAGQNEVQAEYEIFISVIAGSVSGWSVSSWFASTRWPVSNRKNSSWAGNNSNRIDARRAGETDSADRRTVPGAARVFFFM